MATARVEQSPTDRVSDEQRAQAAWCTDTDGTSPSSPSVFSSWQAKYLQDTTRLAISQVIEGQYWMAPISALWLFGVAACSELPRAISSGAWQIVVEQAPLFCLSASLGFFVNVCSFLVIKSTNSVTLKVLLLP